MVFRQFEPARGVRYPHHRDLASHVVEPDDASRPTSFDRHPAFQLHAEFGEEGDGGVEIVDDDADVVHALNCHVPEDRGRLRRRRLIRPSRRAGRQNVAIYHPSLEESIDRVCGCRRGRCWPDRALAACELVRRGVSVRVIDTLTAPTAQSRAIVVHARSLEMLDRVGVADQIIASGVKTLGMRMIASGRELAHVDLSDVDSVFPFAVTTAQTETERPACRQRQH